jgi:DNA-binding beta-propeller fold protein YncE
VVVTDGGIGEERLRVLDTSGAALRVVAGGEASFPRDGTARSPAIFYGLAFDPNTRTLYASGGGSNRIYAFTLSAAGALTMEPGRTIDLGLTEGGPDGRDPMTGELVAGYPAGLALSDDGASLYVALQRGHELAVISTATRRITRSIAFPRSATSGAFPYAVARRPGDARRVYVSLWGQSKVAEVDVEAGSLSRAFDVGKNPTEMHFSSDGARLFVVASDSDAISTVDLGVMTPTVRRHYLGGSESAPRGLSPTALSVGPDGRFYVVLADENAVEVLEPDTFARVGRIATEWYPTDVLVDETGRVLVTTGKGLGSGPSDGSREIVTIMGGSIARYDAPTNESLRAGEAQSRADSRPDLRRFTEGSTAWSARRG